MADYFKEYSSFVGGTGLSSPADKPYETPAFIRSKRSSRTAPNRDHSPSPPPPDGSTNQSRARDSQYSPLDPRRFTPTLHASLVSEILNLRRELDSKNGLVENLEQSLANAKEENETISEQLARNAKELRQGKLHVQQMEKGSYEAVEELAKERDAAVTTAEELRAKLEAANKKTRLQDEDAVRTQGIWENDKETWEKERRQLERRVHVTETRLRAFVDEMASQQAAMHAQKPQTLDQSDDQTFKDSGFGNESDAGSVRSFALSHHRRNMSSVSSPAKSPTMLRKSLDTPEPASNHRGHTLADELDSDPEDEDEIEEEAEDLEQAERRPSESSPLPNGTGLHSRMKSLLQGEALPDSPTIKLESVPLGKSTAKAPPKFFIGGAVAEEDEAAGEVLRETPKYVDSGYQPSPPQSPISRGTSIDAQLIPVINEPMLESEPALLKLDDTSSSTPITRFKSQELLSAPVGYSTASTQTDMEDGEELPKAPTVKHDSLEPPLFVPAIAIHPPSSRPPSPRPYALPPGTKNASTQANIRATYKDASMQTGEIRVDKRPPKIPQEYLRARRLPSKTPPSEVPQVPQTPKTPRPPTPKSEKRKAIIGPVKILTNVPPIPSPPSPPLQSPTETSPVMSRDNSSKDLRSLRAIPLPRPVLAPPAPPTDATGHGHLNRTAQYGVTRPLQGSAQLGDIEDDTDTTDYEDDMTDTDQRDFSSSLASFNKPPQGRFGLSEPPKAVPEDKEISPERRPDTAGSYSAAPAPSIASSRATSAKTRGRTGGKMNTYKDIRSRSPSFTSLASSTFSGQSAPAIPPFPIPVRSSSYFKPQTYSDGSQSPTPPNQAVDAFGGRSRSSNNIKVSPNRLRKVQSAAVIRENSKPNSPVKPRRRRRSPNLTPVQSVAYEFPEPTKFPIPELPTPLQERQGDMDLTKGSVDLSKQSVSTISEPSRPDDEVNLVDAIAATMVGEWMFKYIRKRKSFGVGEDTSDVQHQGQKGTVSIPAHGTRHKRWVWLSPYERTIMWDNKQPTSGAALMGKKGRKLVIEHVMDVVDNTPLPKGSGLDTAFHRSILILTPARALKFTSTNKERHGLWMTALSFLAQSGALPPSMPDSIDERVPTTSSFDPHMSGKRSRSPSFSRSAHHETSRATTSRREAFSPRTNENSFEDSAISPDLFYQDAGGAEAPAIPRMSISTNKHNRNRSNTNPALPPTITGFRSFSSNAIPSSTSSSHGYNNSHSTNGRLQLSSITNSALHNDFRSSSSKGGSRQESLASSADRPNFFEAVGTVRMEAFVDPGYQQGVRYIPAPPPGSVAPVNARRRRNDSNLSASTTDKRRAGYVFDENGVDPFQGF